MDAAQDFGLPNSISNACIAGVHHIDKVGRFCTSLADNCALGPAIDKGLNRVAVYFDVHVKHCHLPEKLRILLHGCLKVLLDESFPDVFFDLSLCCLIVRVGVPQPHDPFLLLPIGVKVFLKPLLNDFAKFGFFAVGKYLVQIFIICLKSNAEVGVRSEHLFDVVALTLDP